MIKTEQKNRKRVEIMKTMNPIAWIRDSEGFKKTTTALTVFFFLFTFYTPSALAIKQAAEKPVQPSQPVEGLTAEEKLSNTLQTIKERVRERETRLAQRVQQESNLWQDFLNLFGRSELAAEDLSGLLDLHQQVEGLHQSVLKNFDAIEQELKQKKLPAEILRRHHDAVDKYKAEYQNFQIYLQRCRNAVSLQDQQAAIEELDAFLQGQQFKRNQQPFDPENLPFATPDPKQTRQPVTDKRELDRLLGLAEPPGVLENVIDGVIATAYAQAGDQPAAADLQPTVDVQITPAIQQKAAELNHDPVRIYNWVRNTIDFMPTYGSIQGSEATLQSLRGNAFDTASLLIALLRASNIPARYAYGVVQMPADQAMNWIGGAEVPMAALQVLGQGGIPARGLSQGGVIRHIELEHIWVEAWVDFEPSRGAKNIEGDNWVSLDASFKQYNYIEGMNIQQSVPFDAEAFVDTIANSAVIDGQAGSVRNIDRQFVENQLNQYQQQVDQFVAAQNPDATVADVLGTRIIQQINAPALEAALPYRLVNRTSSFPALSDSLRHKYQIQLVDLFGSPVFSRTLDMPAIAGKTLALSFRPKTQQDEQTLRSFIPGNITDISQLPQNLPGYLVKLEAEWVTDGQEQLTGTTYSLGEELDLKQALYTPGSGWKAANSRIVAGEYQAIAVDTGASNPRLLDALRADLAVAKARLESFQQSGDETLLADLTKHQLTGAVLQTGVLAWFAINNRLDTLTARQLKIIDNRLPSFGKFGTSARVEYSWGNLPRRVGFPGVMMDLDLIRSAVAAKDNDNVRKLNYLRITGSRYSAFEHLVPEQLFSTPQSPAQGISAVKALGLAAAEGQTIYTLTQANSGQLNNISIDAAARAEIRNALNAGQEVTVHERPIHRSGWSGSGYIIFDPETGSGAYKISGGADGGVLLAGIAILGIAIVGIAGMLAGVLISPMLLALTLSLALHIIVLELIFNDDIPWSEISAQIFAIVGIVATAIGAMFSIPGLVVAMAIISILASVLGLL